MPSFFIIHTDGYIVSIISIDNEGIILIYINNHYINGLHIKKRTKKPIRTEKLNEKLLSFDMKASMHRYRHILANGL
jgi:hypothetical protein